MTFYAQPGRDGRRTSDPLQDLSNNPAGAPGWQLVRLVSADDDATSRLAKANGVNFGGFRKGYIQVVPLATSDLDSPSAGTANPTLALYVWCPILEKFVSLNPAASYSGLGAGLPYVVDVTLGGIVMPNITGTIGGSEVVAVYASCFVLDDNP